MKRLMSAAFAAVALAGAVSAATVYSVSDRILTIRVPEGETNSVVATDIECANDNSVTNIVKTGTGAIIVDKKLADYEGDIHIEQGMWVIACTNALGKLSSQPDCSDVGAVFVTAGGSLAAGGNDRFISNKGKKIYISGSGVAGEGALTLMLSTAKGDYGSGVFGRNIELTGDAVIGHNSDDNVYFTQSKTQIRLNGHKLSFSYDNASKKGYVFGGTDGSEVFAPGEIELSGRAVLIFLGRTVMNGDDGRMTFKDHSKFGSNGMRGRYEWPMDWDSDGEITIISQTTGDVATNRNTWHGPVRLGKNMKVSLTKSGTFGLFAPVSGPGGLDVRYDEKNKSAVPTNFVNLFNSGSSFSGGARISDLVLNVKARDALPRNGGALVLTNSIVNFDSVKNYALPDGFIHVKDGSEMKVEGGSGSWKTLVKTGPGTVNYSSSIGADVLDVKEGVVLVGLPSIKCFAGLIEGVGYFKTGGESYYAARDLSFTNQVVLAPNDAYTNKTYWTHVRPEWDVVDKAIHSSATVYSGYMWNNEPTNVNWTFCCRVGTVSFFRLGQDLDLLITDGKYNEAVLVTVENVTPGPHKFHFGSYATIDAGGAGGSATNWPSLGFRWDPFGRGSTDTNNFVKLEDPGDGSLFTWAIPGDDVFYPGTDESNKIGYLPRFDTIKFSGGTLNLNVGTNVFRVGEVEGFPSVVNGNGFAIENKWTIDAEDIAAGMKVLNQKIDFGEDVELEIENPLAARSVSGVREWMVLESTEDITGSISVKDAEVAKRWTVKVDGGSVTLKYRPVGTIMVVR